MKKYKMLIAIFIVFVFSPLFHIGAIYGYMIDSDQKTNQISLSDKTSYTVIHEQMNLDGRTYTEYSSETVNNVSLGTIVSPEVLSFTGFDSPERKTVTINSYNHIIIKYQYNRKSFNLTVNGSNYVTPSTATGSYLYGTEINLVADPTDEHGNQFVKWSNGETNINYTFTMTDNVTIFPVYEQSYLVTFEPNNGASKTTKPVIKTEAVGTMPNVKYNDCVGETGDYLTRQCTYFYQFEGWYKEPTFENEVNEAFVPTGDITLYAKWDKIYYGYYGSKVFDGTANSYIDTEIALFNEAHADKDFVITFTVDTNNGYNNSNGDRGTIFADMNEVGEPFQGVHFFTKNNTNYTMNVNVQGSKKKDNNTGYITGQKVVIKKVNGYVYYSYNDGLDVLINNFSTFSPHYDRTATFGAGKNAQGNIYRYFIGTLSDMSVEIKDRDSYIIHYDANGGTGTMPDQIVEINRTVDLSANSFTYADGSFGGWNTEPDGSGTSYTNRESITNLLAKDEEITLYAQWIPTIHYYVHFEANGGTGTMPDQRFNYDSIPVPLDAYDFTRPGYIFKGWNTAADGSGTAYQDEEQVCDLTDVPDGIVTLYAQYRRIAYENSGDIVFDGTANTFIDTGVNVFSTTNFNKDFEIRFTFKSIDSDVFDYTPEQPTMFNVKDESNNKYPGFNIRFNGGVNTMTPTYRWGGNTVNKPSSGIATSNAPIEFVYRRVGNNITMEYSYGGNTYRENLFNQTSWTLNQDFATNVAFGGYFNSSNQPGRFFKGTLADIIIIIDE